MIKLKILKEQIWSSINLLFCRYFADGVYPKKLSFRDHRCPLVHNLLHVHVLVNEELLSLAIHPFKMSFLK
jgi:hypothetical protein